ncbi:MAG: hypothetical protein HON47_02800 [Candidatus Diapherotrites archaeon]|jgi:hypothetical protein|uniref:Kazal-like domain-containing protein n=1 Tax=Candidatus Iainarchaeum sp. TaxID=3101447 RepID=A0A8T5GG26_9ARCH|nr:hypothetical protein [Candidatus Diapherotrites archaeon]MBT7241576.1 hypothetical protein [Candidatus Diapherotrites archaeon]
MERKNFLVLFIILIFSISFVMAVDSNNDTNSGNTVCTTQYDPVCGQIVDCPTTPCITNVSGDTICASCLATQQTFSNLCELNAAGATYLDDGVCEDTTTCPAIAIPMCAPGTTMVTTVDSDGCVEYDCEEIACTDDAKICPDGSAVGRDPNNNCEFKPCPIGACTMQYDPVCAEVTTCTTGDCTTTSPTNSDPNTGISSTCVGGVCFTTQKTYGNACQAKADGAKIIYRGECDNASLITESVKCVFDDSTTNQQCYLARENNIGCSVTANEEACVVDVKKEMGKILTWKSTCGGYAQTVMDGINEHVKFDCTNNGGAVKETVKCVLEGAKGGEECYSNKGKCKVNVYHNPTTNSNTGANPNPSIRNSYGTCTVDVRGNKGETVTWKSDCGGYAYTIMDGDNEYAKFRCNGINPPVEELYRKAKWTCTNEMEFEKEDNCQPYSFWKKLAIRTCNQYSSTCVSPISSTTGTVVSVVNSTSDGNSETVTIDDSNTAVEECIGDLITVEDFEVSDKCERTCTREKDSQGCIVTNCGEGPSIIDCPAQSCRIQPIEEIRKIKNECYNKNGKVIVEINEGNGCSHYNCVSINNSKACITDANISIERKLKCEDKNGEFIVNTNATGCIDFMKCVGGVDDDSNKVISEKIINDSTKLLELALKLENLKIELEKIQKKIDAVATFHTSNGDTNSATNFENASALIDEAIQKIDELKTFIKDNVDDFTKEDGQYVRGVIGEIRGELMKEILLAILG